jgi:hypothetical protein
MCIIPSLVSRCKTATLNALTTATKGAGRLHVSRAGGGEGTNRAMGRRVLHQKTPQGAG